MKDSYDVVIIGGGHAGVEAASASARLGASTLLVTLKPENLGEMSCNPSIGGVAKGIIVKEIDAMGGVMPRAIDISSIHSKILNESKGPAVHGPRAQADRKLYRKAVSSILSDIKNLEIYYASVEDLIIDKSRVTGVMLENGRIIKSSAVVLTTGTFLNGLIHIGRKKFPAGRINENASTGLANSLRKLNFRIGRLKTGTPPRLDAHSINWDILEKQPGDVCPKPFSAITKKIDIKQINCYITHTNNKTHNIIQSNAHNSPMFLGEFEGKGPRYCPSIEDKIIRFSHKASHQIFLEPEGLDTNVIYPNGISTSLPEEAQNDFLRSIKGLEEVIVLNYGYAIEYDYIHPSELLHTLETKKIQKLFLAGQINGTTGYEEAAGQGLLAGINAASSTKFILDRSQAYIGVMIDDLINFDLSEPYRVLTSRSEYRLSLRSDNADIRLSPEANSMGLLSLEQSQIFEARVKLIDKCRDALFQASITPYNLLNYGINIAQDGVRRTGVDLLSYPNIGFDDLINIWEHLDIFPTDIKMFLEAESKYRNYLIRQQKDIDLFKQYEMITLPEDLDYNKVEGLSNEAREKLSANRPMSVGSAGRIYGITPASIISLIIYLRRNYDL
jgi:tRNA uridine 5-carboxymethylaminomethyl modification enzyme